MQGSIKKILGFVSIIVLSFNCFAVAVSDNDGSAFITKAEFDSLKNDFQSQIDQYNTSIDSKIDAAIASYLAGIKISKQETLSTLYAPSEGVYSLEASAFPWTEGRMDMKFYGGLFRYSSSTQVGYFEFSLSTTSPTNFKETLVSNVDYTAGTGSFVGYYQTKQFFVSNGNNAKNYGFRQYGLTDITGYNGGYFPISNQVLSTAGQVYTIGFYNDTWATDYWGTNVLECMGNQASFRRELVSSGSYTGGLIMNTSSLSHKFNNYDEYRDWCNDSTDDGHSLAYSMDAVGLTGSGSHVDITPNGSGGISATVVNATILTSGDITGGEARGTQRKPYLGFVTNANNWNKIYIDSFDEKMDAVLPSSDLNYSNNIIINSKGNHLKLGAGLPVIQCKEGDKVKYQFEFKDKTKDYSVWVKEGSFDSSKDLYNDKVNCINDFDFTGSTSSYDSASNSIHIKNGSGKASFKVNSNKIVYLKWAIYGNTNAGGGILLPASTVEVVHE